MYGRVRRGDGARCGRPPRHRRGVTSAAGSRRSPSPGCPAPRCRTPRDRIRPAVEHAGLRVAAAARRREPRARQPAQGGTGPRPARSPSRCWPPRRRCPSVRSAGWAFAGELSLKGELLPTPGILSVAIAAARAGLEGVVVPARQRVGGGADRGPPRRGRRTAAPTWSGSCAGRGRPPNRPAPAHDDAPAGSSVDLADVRGQQQARRALEVAAAGRPQPADGRLARRGQDHAGAAARHDPARASPARRRSRPASCTRWRACWPAARLLRARPFRAPHHTVSTAGFWVEGSTVPAAR